MEQNQEVSIDQNQTQDYQKLEEQKKQYAYRCKQIMRNCKSELLLSYKEQQKIIEQKNKIIQTKEKIKDQKYKNQDTKTVTFDSFKKPHLYLRIQKQEIFDTARDKYLDRETKYIDLSQRQTLIFPDKMFKKEPFFDQKALQLFNFQTKIKFANMLLYLNQINAKQLIKVKTMTYKNLFGKAPIEPLNKNLQELRLKQTKKAQELEKLETLDRVRKSDGFFKKKSVEAKKSLLFQTISPHMKLLDQEVRSVFFESVRKFKQI